MQYRVRLFDILGDETIKVFPDAVIGGWSKRMNAPGKASFWLPARSRGFEIDDLQKYKRIRFERKRRDGSGVWDTVWYGYIEAHKRMDENRIGVACQGMLNIFKKRMTTDGQSFSGQGSDEAFGLLSAANGANDTGLTEGLGGVTTTKAVTSQGRIDMLRALEQLAQAHKCEFQVNDDGTFDFVPLLGTDKSGTIRLKFRRDGKPGNNVRDVLEGEDGAPMANRIYAKSTNGGDYTWNDSGDSVATYGLLEISKQFNEAQDAGTLQSMAEALGSQLANPITDFQAIPILEEKRFRTASGIEVMTGLSYGDLVPGDLVMAEIVTETQVLEEARRIAEIVVDVDQNEAETVKYTLSKAGVFVTSNMLDLDQVRELKRQIREIEGVLA